MKTPSLFTALLVSAGTFLAWGCAGNGDGSPQPTATNSATATLARTFTATPTSTTTPTSTPTPIVPPAVPENLQVPAGNTVFLVGDAVGTQDYICLPSGSAFAWTFVAPQATLFNDTDEQIITHFLSPNPAEAGTARPTWQHSDDTSAVWAKKIQDSSDADFVAAGAIPWLLLQVVGTQPGPNNGATLTATTYIQRLLTSGGVAPSTGCMQTTDVGKVALVPYTATYLFYKAGS